ncbi:MAG: DUF177 domain-containing protein [Rhodospirillales bacterium]|nr:DUF177 domain-containing protein [Rhodospirillales bacterium]
MTPAGAPAPEFSRPVAADRIGRDGYQVTIEATPAERAALTARLGLVSLEALTARCRLRQVAGGMIELKASFEAAVTQQCVVSLEPFPARVADEFTQRYALDPQRLRKLVDDAEMFDPEADDPPEALAEGGIDLGEAVAQQLAVALDPFPRAPGVSFEGSSEEPSTAVSTGLSAKRSPTPVKIGDKGETPTKPNPFAVLSKFKK